MRRILPALLLLIAVSSYAQHNLSSGRRSSVNTYIYKINVEEAWKLAKSEMKNADERFLHTIIDSFPTEKPQPELKEGNYLVVNANKNKLQYRLVTSGDLQYKLVNNDRDFVLYLHSKQGQLISDAKVFLGNKKLDFDPRVQGYLSKGKKKKTWVRIYSRDVLYAFPVAGSTYYRKQGFWRKISTAFPLKYIVAPIRKLVKHQYYRSLSFEYGTAHERKFRGFMVFNKPKFKPGDTVRLKAFVTNRKGKPFGDELLVRVSNYRLKTDSVIGTIKPYRRGSFEFSFALNDSLDLDLDDEYKITLEEKSSLRYDYSKYKGLLSDDEYAAKRKVVLRGNFDYEEYELKSINFSARADKDQHNRGEAINIYLKATDENGLSVMDGRVVITVVTNEYHPITYGGTKLFIPDTLWKYEQMLDPVGETKVLLPDSIFPNASFNYRIECTFLNSNNEIQTRSLGQAFNYSNYKIYFEQSEDSLAIDYIVQGKSVPADATIYARNENGDTILTSTIKLPATIKINRFSKDYLVTVGDIKSSFTTDRFAKPVSCLSLRTKDSIKILLDNPWKLPVWYTVYANKKLIHRGVGDSLFFQAKTRTSKHYFVSLQYVFGDMVHKEDYTIPYQNKLLKVETVQPEFIYPGQTTSISINVKDAAGHAVPGADVTAYAYTQKFKNATLPYVPYLGKYYKGRKKGPRYRLIDHEDSVDKNMNWQRWSREMSLDTIEYYKFLHPTEFYINAEPVKDSITQVAPFLVKGGDIVPIQQIYIDEMPVYFNRSQQLERYSFRISPGRHSLRFRTLTQMISFDSLQVTKGVKTFISINIDTSNKKIHFKQMPESLTEYEMNLWNKYMILVENNFGEKYASIEAGGDTYLVKYNSYYYGSTLVGPIPNVNARLEVKDNFQLPFEVEGGYRYTFKEGLIKQKQLNTQYLFKPYLANYSNDHNFSDFVLTEAEVEALWQDYLDHRSAREDLFRNDALNKYGNGKLTIHIASPKNSEIPFIKNILVFRKDDPDFLRVYKGNAEDMGYLRPGEYNLFFLLKSDDYYIADSITIKKGGINFYEIGPIHPKLKDSVSIKIWKIISTRSVNGYSYSPNFDDIKESYYQSYLDTAVFIGQAAGIVKDVSGRPIPWAIVRVKGTKFGTTTDDHGRFRLAVPGNGTLEITSVGFTTQYIRINDFASNDITLTASSNSLNEVVVTGFTSTSKSKYAGATSSITSSEMLQGKVPGIMIRGTSSVDANSEPLYVVDGLPVDAKTFREISKDDIGTIEVLRDQAATVIYGSRGSNGVILVTTKKGIAKKELLDNQQQPGNSIRSNFNDAAYWQPKLRTDKEGNATFKVTFPDDITNWRTIVIATAEKKQTGFAEGNVKSFKALSAAISLPQFILEGDSVNVIGKSMNYLADSIIVKRKFSIDSQLVAERSFGFRNSKMDTFSIVAGARDSMTLKYSIEKENGYFDGEERSIPIFKQGVMEANGVFAALNGDTTLQVYFKNPGRITIYAEASLLNIFERESEKVRNYEYLCNEQLASKLKAWLVQKTIDSMLRRPFKGDKNIRELIGKLNQNKNGYGLWGWWKDSDAKFWISLHVMEALVRAQSAGYSVSIPRTALSDYLIYNLESVEGTEKVNSLNLLYLLNTKADFAKYIDTIEKRALHLSMYEKLNLAELKQKLGLKTSLDTLKAKQHQTMFGNIYWGDESYSFFDNSIQNTLLAYRLFRNAGESKDYLQKIRNYFLEKRRDGNWRNTYESSLILETILPDILVNDSLPKPPTLKISGQDIAIHEFPFATELSGSRTFRVTKQGTLPIYFTAYEEHWNNKPARVENDFAVTSVLEKNGETLNQLKAGEPAILKVNVSVKKDADYVMVEVPIPAGCSYNDKRQSYINNEVHREYFKNKVSIFCSSLKRGNYTFTISLLPRYTGRYNLNPAKAELMYFPVFFGREAMKKISIQ